MKIYVVLLIKKLFEYFLKKLKPKSEIYFIITILAILMTMENSIQFMKDYLTITLMIAYQIDEEEDHRHQNDQMNLIFQLYVMIYLVKEKKLAMQHFLVSKVAVKIQKLILQQLQLENEQEKK